MLKSLLKPATEEGEGDLLGFHPPLELIADDGPTACMALTAMTREGGLLLAIPAGYLLPHCLTDGAASDEASMVGPNKEFTLGLIEEGEDGAEVKIEQSCQVVVIDMTDEALENLREYDPVIDPSANIQPFSDSHPMAIADLKGSLATIKAWVAEIAIGPRLHFYSAREEQEAASPKRAATRRAPAGPKKITTAQLAQQVAALTTQLEVLAKQQEVIIQKQEESAPVTPAVVSVGGGALRHTKLPDVSTGFGAQESGTVPQMARLVGPPPRTRPAPSNVNLGVQDTGVPLELIEGSEQSPVARALMQQTSAITTLVAHLASGDPIADFSAGSSSSQTLNTQGVARREKMQQELASGQSNFFLQVQQQIHKKMFPAKMIPKTEEEIRDAGISLTGYLERFGGYKGRQDSAMLVWMLAHALDASSNGNHLFVPGNCMPRPGHDGRRMGSCVGDVIAGGAANIPSSRRDQTRSRLWGNLFPRWFQPLGPQ